MTHVDAKTKVVHTVKSCLTRSPFDLDEARDVLAEVRRLIALDRDFYLRGNDIDVEEIRYQQAISADYARYCTALCTMIEAHGGGRD